MSAIYVVTAIALVGTGVVIGVLAVVSLGIRRDDRRGGFPADTNDRMARSARRMTGAGARGAELAREISHRQDTLAGSADQAAWPAAEGIGMHPPLPGARAPEQPAPSHRPARLSKKEDPTRRRACSRPLKMSMTATLAVAT